MAIEASQRTTHVLSDNLCPTNNEGKTAGICSGRAVAKDIASHVGSQTRFQDLFQSEMGVGCAPNRKIRFAQMGSMFVKRHWIASNGMAHVGKL